MNRRDALLTTGSMVVSASLGAIACGGGHAVAQNTKTPPVGSAPPPPHHHGGGNGGLTESAANCFAKGQACLAHCIGMLAAGDTSMAGCAPVVHAMTAVMQSLAALAAAGSPRLPAFAKVALEFCKDCEAECRKHAAVHAVCKECADACAHTVAEAQKIAA